jgi:hypothetical protein
LGWLRAHRVAGGKHQGAQAGAAVQQQRVVGTIARALTPPASRGAADLFLALDEVVEV